MKNSLFILLFFICTYNMYANGYNDWIYETNNGTVICDSGDGAILWKDNEPLHLKRWYFYKNHIIGEYDTFINPEYVTGYFILNELNGKLKTYSSKEPFEKSLHTQELQPVLWTRWYYDHYTILYFLFILYIVSWPTATTLFAFITLLIFLSITLKHRLSKIIFIVITAILLIPLLLFILNDYFTSSI